MINLTGNFFEDVPIIIDSQCLNIPNSLYEDGYVFFGHMLFDVKKCLF
jgi:hypothetical protein